MELNGLRLKELKEPPYYISTWEKKVGKNASAREKSLEKCQRSGKMSERDKNIGRD